jgi:acyl-[acyl-carrier-protein]-phospholipid O-acyltransferase/long-chain-fatty-acid--[acyl-carrier-protein] ligase
MNTVNRQKSFWALIATQFFGAFNDNIFKVAVALLVVKWIDDPVVRNNWVTASGVVFVTPFLLFSLVAGRMADRWSKAQVMRATKVFELFVVSVAVGGMYLKSVPLVMGGLFCLALQSAFFGPSKYGVLPEIIENARLSSANGLLNVSTFAAILAGTVAATFLIERVSVIAVVMFITAIGGVISSFLMDKVPAVNPTQSLKWNPLPDFFTNWALIKGNNPIRHSLMAVSYFWFAGAVLQLNTLIYVNDVLKASSQISGILLTLVVVGIALGSVLAGKLSQEKVELGLVPLGAIGMSLFTLDLYFSQHSLARTLADGFFLGLSSGVFVIPLNTLIQSRSPQEDRGRILATANFLSFVAILLASGFLWFLETILKANPAQVFLALGIVSLIATLSICITIPQAMIRLVLYFLTNTVYRIRVIGRENVPLNGPAILVPNHVSMVDPFLIAGGISRQVRFMMFRDFYEKPLVHPLVKLMNAIPISNNDAPKEIMKSLINARKQLQEGHLVCIFAEGEISRLGGAVLGFKRGLEVILKDLDVPIVPVHLEGVWGSIFSFQDKKFIWKWPRRIPYPVTVTFGKPLHRAGAQEIRQAVMDLGADAFKVHRQAEPTLFETFLGQAKSSPNQKIVVDSNHAELTCHRLLTGATLFGRHLVSKISSKGSDRNIGVLLPPCVGATLANVALSSQGLVPINLNYTLSRDALDSICRKASISTVVTSQKMLEKLGYGKGSQHVFLEDVLSKIPSHEKLITGLLLRLLPVFILKRTFYRKATKNLNELATIMFTSGSTGIPKGVMLTEGNILSNIQALTMVLHMRPTDVLLGVLPFFHSFGFTASLWFPLLAGFKVAYHNNPLDSKTIGDLCRTQRVTFLIGTPTFIAAYIRRIPKEDFATLRFAVAGAEKLRPELAKAFEEKYGVPLLEGYGCTELSPVVALNLPDIMDGEVFQVGRKVGKIGRPITGVSVKIVDPNTNAPLKAGEAGLLLVKGPNVMKGYLGEPEKTAEVVKEGWYVTGDIATVDEDGFIQITDRLSRFSKIGGEMVPHVMVEQKLHELAATVDRLFVVTGVPDDKKGEALAVLVGGYKGDLDLLWKNLNATDLPKLWIPARDKFFPVDAIPALGSGKVDMVRAKSLASELSLAK